MHANDGLHTAFAHLGKPIWLTRYTHTPRMFPEFVFLGMPATKPAKKQRCLHKIGVPLCTHSMYTGQPVPTTLEADYQKARR